MLMLALLLCHLSCCLDVVAVCVFPKQLCCGVLSDWVGAKLRLKEDMWIASASVVVIWAGLGSCVVLCWFTLWVGAWNGPGVV